MTAPGGAVGSWEDLARGANRRGEEEEREILHLLTFVLDDAAYALRVESVREIVRMRSMTPIPRVSNAVRGVVSLRGEIVQVVDLRQRLRLPAAEPSRASRIVVVHLEDGRVAGLLVDAVREVMKVDANAVLSPTAGEASAVEALCQRGNTFVSMIDLQRVLEFDVES